jgi:N-acetylmuramoyl-L-alanine amidase
MDGSDRGAARLPEQYSGGKGLFALLKQTRTGLFIAMIGLMLMSVISPMLAIAATDLVPGDDAIVVKDTNLYSDSSRDSNITAEVTVDTPVSIVDGPFTVDDGTQWYWVRVWEQTGYMPAVDLDGVAPAPATEEATAEEAAPAESETVPTRPWQEPIKYGVANDNVMCRVDVSTSADDLIRVATGQTIEITGDEVWAEGIGWLPVNCAGVGGFIATDYVTVDAPEAAVETEVATEVATEVVTEEVVETEAATEVVTEEVVETQVPTEVVTDAATETEAARNAVSSEVAEPVTAGPAQVPINVTVAIDDVVCRVDVSTSAAQITVVANGATVEVTGAPVDAEGLSWTPVNCAGVGGFVATQYIDAGAAAETATEVATDEAAAEEATDEAATDEPATGEPTEVVTDETATDEATDVATEEAGDVEAGTATPVATDEATEAVTDETVTEDATEVATDDAAENTDATPVADETEAATEEATDEATEATDATPVAEETEAATEEASETPVGEEQLESGQAVAETDSTMPVEDSEIIGTAEIRGPDGAGIACRVAPDNTSTVISVLPEGMNALVLSAPDGNGWMSIVCNGEVGYVHSTYLYSGGAASDFSADKASYANVDATGGAGLNCRSGPGTSYSVIGYFPAGSGVNVRGAAQGDWVPVVCGGSNGWVFGSYLIPASTPGKGDSNTSGDSGSGGQTTGTMTVTGTNGDGLRCRTAPNGSVITVMAEGTKVSVRGAAENGWVPIVCGGQNGYASSQYLGGSSGSGDNSGGDTSKPGGDSGVTSGTVTVSGTGGSSLNCRSGAGTGYGVVTSVREGTVLNVRGAAENGWQPVVCNGANAWVSTMYITAGGSAPGGDTGSGNDGGSNTPDPSTGTATVVNTDGDSLRCRTSPTGSVITMLAPGSSVALRAETSGAWQGIVCAGQNGFAHSDYLSIGGGSTNPTPTPTPDPGNNAGLGNGDHAKVTENLNLRYEPSSGAGVATYAPAGTVVLITGAEAGNGYYPVNWDGLKGYMHGDYLTKTDEALSKRGGSANPTDPPPTTGGGGSTATGNAIVDYAMGYVGYPYVWATHGPYSFDCSGFTSWVIQNVVGKSIGYSVWPQLSAGSPVSRSNLQPGDLVFFQNTYKSGVSHVGIYIGGSQFVHAENETTGVKISDLNSNYYGSRWYGAVRIN